ncbi:hypothetical protein FRC03_001452 [Tulasnella sp. 419]|nr:hypothetical protein FRC03_001452 [Tulasnella sp. 419]
MSKVSPRIWTRKEISDRILQGDTLVIYRSFVLRISPNWLKEHPGGALSILHFVGRDATDEIDAYHAEKTLKRVMGFAVGRVDVDEKTGWEPLVPPLQAGWVRTANGEWTSEAIAVRSDEKPHSTSKPPNRESITSEILLVDKNTSIREKGQNGPTLEAITPAPSLLSLSTQTRHAKAYRALHDRITAAGLYKTPYLTGYGPEIIRYVFMAGASYYLYQKGWFLSSAFFLGLLWHQLSFTAHDLGHMGVTHRWTMDRIIGVLCADFIGGLSIGWWVDVSTPVFYYIS